MATSGFYEEFLQSESKVHQLMKLLEDISNSNKKEEELASAKKQVVKDIYEEISESNFLITSKDTCIISLGSKKSKLDLAESLPPTLEAKTNLDKFSFMQQFEKDAEQRAKIRKERERIAQNFRILGNDAYRKQNYEKAITLYTKAINHIKDSPFLYNNRALCHIKLKSYKRAIMDCDYVLNKLDEKNLRSWLYRAAAYKRAADENNYEKSLEMAQRTNPKKIRQIDVFLRNFKSEGI